MPEHRITASASLVNGLTLVELKKLGANNWTKGKSEILTAFLNEHPDLPIVAQSANYDRDDVLGKAFNKVGNINIMPNPCRWRCTYKLSNRLPKS